MQAQAADVAEEVLSGTKSLPLSDDEETLQMFQEEFMEAVPGPWTFLPWWWKK